MKVLWIASHGGNYKDSKVKGTGGWIGALQTYLKDKVPDMELGICFEHKTDSAPVKDDNVTYFPIYNERGSSVAGKLYKRFFTDSSSIQKRVIYNMLHVVNSFKPDIIHIWGIENDYADIIPLIHNTPHIVHIQGLTSAYLHTYCPPGFSLKDIFRTSSLISWVKYGGEKGRYINFVKRAQRELQVSKYVKNWMGRTKWDRVMSKMLSADSSYYHCDEMMRPSFNDGVKWKYHFNGQTIMIQSNISEDWYKGMDVVLKTAKILKEKGYNINWRIFGWNRDSVILKTISQKLDINPDEVGVIYCGRVGASVIKEELLKSDMYVHPSYIENSSNAIAEAQLLGVPVIAQYVGGNPSMLKNDSGLLVQPNDPYMMAGAILSMCDPEVALKHSQKALEISTERQNINNIIKDLTAAYMAVVADSKR